MTRTGNDSSRDAEPNRTTASSAPVGYSMPSPEPASLPQALAPSTAAAITEISMALAAFMVVRRRSGLGGSRRRQRTRLPAT